MAILSSLSRGDSGLSGSSSDPSVKHIACYFYSIVTLKEETRQGKRETKNKISKMQTEINSEGNRIIKQTFK